MHPVYVVVREAAMSDIVMLFVGVFLIVYLFCSVLRPERF